MINLILWYYVLSTLYLIIFSFNEDINLINLKRERNDMLDVSKVR